MLHEMAHQNASIFALFIEYEKHKGFFAFFVMLLFFKKCPGLYQHRIENLLGKCRVVIFQKYGKFSGVSLGQFIKQKPLISEFLKIFKIIIWTNTFALLADGPQVGMIVHPGFEAFVDFEVLSGSGNCKKKSE